MSAYDNDSNDTPENFASPPLGDFIRISNAAAEQIQRWLEDNDAGGCNIETLQDGSKQLQIWFND